MYTYATKNMFSNQDKYCKYVYLLINTYVQATFWKRTIASGGNIVRFSATINFPQNFHVSDQRM